MITICSLSFYGPGVMPVRQELENGIEVNAEGAGFAIVTEEHGWGNHGMLMDKSTEPYSILDEFMNLREKFPDGPAAFHSRLSTGSAASLANTHPFAAGGDPETLFFFNGADISGVTEGNDGRADALIFAEDQLGLLDLDDSVHAEAIERATAGRGGLNKALILTSNPRWREQAYVYNRSQWIVTPEGALHSNADFLGKGVGWNEMTLIRPPAGSGEPGDLYRWNIRQPGQCLSCHRYGCRRAECVMPALAPFRWRNESERRRKVEAAS